MPKILAIDDKQDNLITLSAILKNLIPECHVITAQSGPEGIEKAKIHSPDTIISDIKMPGMDGYEVCKKLKEDNATRAIPVILISAIRTGPKDLVKGLDTGADAYLAKPIDEHILIAQVKTALRMKEAEDLLRRQKDSLEDMVRERTAELINSNVQLKREIADRKQAEEALRESEVFLETLIDAIPTPVFYKDRDGKYLGFNRAFETFFGETKEQLIGKSVFDINPPELAATYHAKDEKLFINGGCQRYESQVKNTQGKLRDVILNKAVFTDSKGVVAGLIGAIMDITGRKQVEEELRKSEMLHREAQRVAKIGHWELGLPSGTPLWSEEIFHIFGLDPEVSEPSFASHVNIIHDEDWDLLDHSIQELNINGTPFDLEFRILRSGGETRWMHARGSADKSEDGSVTRMFGTAQDITDRKKAEEDHNKLQSQLQQAQKMEAIGALAGGIAHDFNNVLYAVMGYTELTMDLVPEGSKAQINLQRVMKAAGRAKEMVQQILAFSRQSKKEKKPISVQSVLKEAGNLLRTSIPSTIEIRQDIDTECDAVMADPTQIHQIIMNLATNAYHAMQETGGVLGLTLMQDEIGSDDSGVSPDLKPGAYLKLTVEDTGHGIDRDVMGKIFDPYFTTKAVGKGTGMGLSVVYGIVKEHGGDIRVYSEPGQGTAFHVYLPVIETDAAEPNAISVEPAPTGTERILFVDDEEVVVDLAQQMLETLGYHVTTHTGSVAALEAFRGHPDEFDLVITDMTMPKMTGAELAPRLLEIRPDIPIILCTGFSDLIDEGRAGTIGIRAYLAKPILKNEMAKVIRKMLGKPNAD